MDFDGTLADFAAHPSQVSVVEHLPKLLHALSERLEGGLAIVTGRRLDEIDALLAPTVLPGAGVHGAEIRALGGTASHIVNLEPISDLARKVAECFAPDTRLLVEDKRAALALHFRQAPERALECIEVMKTMAAPLNLEVIVGDMVVEALSPDIGKGKAIRRLLKRPPFKARMPVFIGDSAFDEEGFAAADDLGGYGVKVGSGETLARYRVRNVSEVHQWLRASLAPWKEKADAA